ncbi:hypothetical protein [Planococcus sp. ISL-110]|uniref:hypothetical protein n=1 Tax=Planococcus sp. ISL-110 TaxID=2819167 RepID=UPI001BE68E25|nr:hypothetical protein [Planococcus sp. ISL-110]MBT2570751.1 hypothetical protein [Planococcus sp. ISL-110]
MNERLIDFLWKSEVARLPLERRRLYEFVIKAEDALAEKAETADEFCKLLLADSPVNAAMNRFQWPYEKVVFTIMETEEELHQKVEHRLKKVKWIDYSGSIKSITANNNGEYLFLFIN